MITKEEIKKTTKEISRILHSKMNLKKYELLPCKTVNNHIEIAVYGNKEKLSAVEKILTEGLNMSIEIDKKYPSIKNYRINNINVIIC